ncbi:Putative SET domain-containing protein [Septoria linicola]|uniref:SET domain-containing protein n=1 Tax=Septoria linicola TaxID=215465 RepID=A0A9Q9AYN1_9PEZI|nr:Putative SET domain-containing protein [Septoria linicola]
MACAGPAEGNHGYYEIRKAGTKGFGAFALKHIPSGTRVLVDTALFRVEKEESQISDADILRQIQALEPQVRAKFDALPYSQTTLYTTAVRRFNLNNFQVRGRRGLSCFAHASRLNHSCLPNCSMTSIQTGKKQCRTIRDVQPDEELTFAYTELLQYMTIAERRDDLRSQFSSGRCECNLCQLPGKQQEISEMRRGLMRHLHFIVYGQDLSPMPQTIPSEYRGPQFMSKSNAAELFVRLAEAEGVEGAIVIGMYCRGCAEELDFRTKKRATVMPPAVLVKVVGWMQKVQAMKAKLMGPEYARKEDDEHFDKLVAVVNRLKAAHGRMDAMWA